MAWAFSYHLWMGEFRVIVVQRFDIFKVTLSILLLTFGFVPFKLTSSKLIFLIIILENFSKDTHSKK